MNLRQRFRWVSDLINYLSVPPRWIVIVAILLLIIIFLTVPEGRWPNIPYEP